MYHGRVVPGLPAAPAPRLRDGDHRPPRPHRSLRLARRRRRASAAATCSGSPPAAASCTAEMFPLLDRERAQPGRALPDLAQPARARTSSSSRTSRCSGAGDIPRSCVHRRRGPRDRGHRRRRALDGRARRRRRRRARGRPAPDTDVAIWTHPDGPGRALDAARAAGRRRARARSTSSRGPSLAVGGRACDAARRARRSARRGVHARGRRRRVRAAAAPGPAHRPARRAVRALRDEHARRDPAGDPRLPAHAVRRLALAEPTIPCTRATQDASRSTRTDGSSASKRRAEVPSTNVRVLHARGLSATAAWLGRVGGASPCGAWGTTLATSQGPSYPVTPMRRLAFPAALAVSLAVASARSRG